jgi:hypothetical protein
MECAELHTMARVLDEHPQRCACVGVECFGGGRGGAVGNAAPAYSGIFRANLPRVVKDWLKRAH